MRRMILAMFLAFVGIVVSPASADYVTATYQGVSNGVNVHVTLPTSGNIYTTAGMFRFDKTSSSGSLAATIADPYYAFCVDLYEYVDSGASTRYDLVNPADIPQPPMNGIQPMGDAKADLLRELYGRHYAGLFNGTNDVVDRQAFQLAVWEIVYESNATLGIANVTATRGLVYVTELTGAPRTAANLADTWLATLDGTGPKTRIIGLADNDSNDLNDQDFVTVPAPGAILLGMLGFAAAGRLRRRFA